MIFPRPQLPNALRQAALVLLAAASCLLLPACQGDRGLARRASAGEIAAQYEYGRRLLTGQNGVRKDPVEAQRWLLAAAQQGHSMAMAALGACHASGIGTPRDLDAARHWYRQSARKGNVFAVLALDELDHPGKPTSRALARLRTDAASRKTEAYRELAAHYLGTKATREDTLRAIDCIRLGAMEGNGEAAYLMAVFYARGCGVPQHDGIARGWLANAAKLGFCPARELMEAQKNGQPLTLP